jgi:cytochrome c biogenesis protein CcmG/thiol:disulfide interchange protein DsbE
MRSKFQILALVTLAVGVTLAAAGCKKSASVSQENGSNAAGASSGASGASVGGGPETTLTIPALDGSQATIAQYKGKVVLVNFWATWCQPCKIEIPWLIEFNEKYGPKGLVILGVAMDDEGKKAVEPFVQKQQFTVNGQPAQMNYTILLGSDKIADKFGGLIGLPTSVLYSREGKKIKTIIGLINYDDLSKALQSQL